MITLSLCIPAFERPAYLERALSSVIEGSNGRAGEMEIVVSDDSRDDGAARVCERLLGSWGGSARRVENRPRLGMVENFNRCVALATGRYVLILHDDDYLVPDGVAAILDATTNRLDQHPVLLFGVEVVDEAGRLQRRQRSTRERYLPPEIALTHVLSNSSYVRFPGVVVQKDAYLSVGPFDSRFGGATDLDMWIRLFARYGVKRMPRTVSAYSVHPNALTNAMFNAETIATLGTIFDGVAAQHLLPEGKVRRCEADFFAQFILGGAYRQLRRGDREQARAIIALSELPGVRAVGPSRRWLPVKFAMALLMRAPLPLLSRTGRWLERLYRDTSILWPR